MTIYNPTRLFASARQGRFAPTIAKIPAQSVIDWNQIAKVATRAITQTVSYIGL
jgi:hypothetical protein